MQINIDKSKFYILVGLLVIMISVVVYANENSGANSKDAFGHELNCNVNVNSEFKDTELYEGQSGKIAWAKCGTGYTLTGGGIYIYRKNSDDEKIEELYSGPFNGDGDGDFTEDDMIDEDVEIGSSFGWACLFDDMPDGYCYAICCQAR